MLITIKFLGGSCVQAGCRERRLDLPAGATVGDAARLIAAAHPRLSPLLARCRWARNLEFANRDDELAAGDELALLPPVSGGASLVDLTTEAINPEEVVNRIRAPSAGAIVVFIGTVRDHSRNERVVRLVYEAYPDMARRQLERIASACAEAQPGARVAISHRHGCLEIGEASVVIAAASAHRAEAFAACRDAIERIKEDLPIWKREVNADGEVWVGWGS